MASRKELHKQLDHVFNPLSLISRLQNQLDSDSTLRAELSVDIEEINAGSNQHLEQLHDVASSIEDDINELLCDLALASHTLKVYSIVSGTSDRSDLDLSEITGVLQKILPNCRSWEDRFHEHFKQLWSMNRSIVQH